MKGFIKFIKALNYLVVKSFTLLVIERSGERFGPELPFNPLGLFYLTTQDIFQVESINNFNKKISGLMFVSGTYICFGYYGFVHYSSIIQDLVRKVNYFGLFMHWIHFIPFIFVVIDIYYHSIEGNVIDFKQTYYQVFIYFVFYNIWGIICFKINNLWPYPFQNEMNAIQMVYFNIFISIFLFFITWMGYIFSKYCFKKFGNKTHLN